jgi:cell division protein ZapA
MSIEQVDVNIMGRQFVIGTPSAESETLRQAVKMLNQKITTIQEHGRIVETDKIVIMAALNLAHDFLKMTTKDGLEFGQFESKINGMISQCEKALAKIA